MDRMNNEQIMELIANVVKGTSNPDEAVKLFLMSILRNDEKRANSVAHSLCTRGYEASHFALGTDEDIDQFTNNLNEHLKDVLKRCSQSFESHCYEYDGRLRDEAILSFERSINSLLMTYHYLAALERIANQCTPNILGGYAVVRDYKEMNKRK